MQQMVRQTKTRSPTLETVGMIEEAISKYSGDNKTKIWKNLKKKVMWQTYMLVINYLIEINKIIETEDKKIVYIWNPKVSSKYKNIKKL